ncbi:MAG: ribonuclease D [Pseudomonadota bacterium]
MDPALLSNTDAVAKALTPLANVPFVTIDTEFMRETTYWPKLCLVQLAGPDGTPVLIDPLADGVSLDPLFELLNNPDVVKVFHAARQDIEIFFHMAGRVPAPIFDTQVAAAVCGFGEAVGYEAIVAKLAKTQIDKGQRFTDWSRRPLNPRQIAYAAADVIHLVDVYLALHDDLDARGRRSWMDADMAILTSPDTYDMRPEEAWRRVKSRLRGGRDLAILMEVAAWREREAQSRDVPRNRIVKDDVINDVAQNKPETQDALGQLRSIPKGYERSDAGAALVEIVREVMARPKSDLPKPLKHDRRAPAPPALTDLLKALLKHVADESGVAARIIATTSDIEAIASDDDADVPALNGWRHEVFGDKALKLKRGDLAFAYEDGRLVVEPRRR